jgi:molybdopterin-synthase adenylyltransferase
MSGFGHQARRGERVTQVTRASDRYDRHRLIPDWDQTRLAAATVVVAGVGALGNEVAKNFALAGVGRLLLCDPDVVSESNLSRTVLFGQAGATKVDQAAASLRRLVPGIEVESRAADLGAGVGLGELAEASAVLGCLDTRRARLRLLGRCALVEAPLIDGGTVPWGGEVRLRLSVNEPCHGCSLTAHQRGASDLPWSCADASDDQPEGASIVSSALIAAWMTAAALRVIFGDPPGYRLLHVDASGGVAAPVTIGRDPTCPHHRPIGTAQDISVGSTSTVGELLADLPSDAEPLTWDGFLLPGNCAKCGTYSEIIPYLEAEHMLCAECGQRTGLPLTQRIRDAGESMILRDLGVAPREILAVDMSCGGFRWLRLSR